MNAIAVLNEGRADAVAAYKKLVIETVSGGDAPSAGELRGLIQSAGRTEADFRADVAKVRRRANAFVAMKRHHRLAREHEQYAAAADEKTKRNNVELKRLKREYDAAAEPLFAENRDLKQTAHEMRKDAIRAHGEANNEIYQTRPEHLDREISAISKAIDKLRAEKREVENSMAGLDELQKQRDTKQQRLDLLPSGQTGLTEQLRQEIWSLDGRVERLAELQPQVDRLSEQINEQVELGGAINKKMNDWRSAADEIFPGDE